MTNTESLPLLSPFHLAVPVADIEQARYFYGEIMGCTEGRSAAEWIDWNFYGHQLVTHQVEKMPAIAGYNHVDGKNVPVPHFGIVLPWAQWERLGERFKQHNYSMYIEPYVRFKDKPGEQGTFFLFDPSENALEFKTFRNIKDLFATS